MQIYLAPMEGITTFVYRNAFIRHYGGVDKYFTPFLSNKNLNYKEVNEISPEHNKNLVVVPQILTNQSEVFLSIAKQLADYGYREVNLNLGCPSGTVVAKKRGAGFLSIPDALEIFLEEIFEKCSLEISIKTRIGMNSVDEWEKLLTVYRKYPLKELIIHPRLQKEFYEGTPHVEVFRMTQERLSTFPLCYNGDIVSKASYDAVTDSLMPVDRIMLGRGVLANPTLPILLKSQTPESIPNAEDIKKFLAFHDEILEGYRELMSGDQPVLFRMKELWAYMRKYPNLSDKQMKQIRKSKRIDEYRSIIATVLGCC
ncbi:MAG: tRNA-dihydrouridine synthase family protein [Lachnospiraceae bacterium]|nr:tRNA-dihydrouridine synthase family protein [Lachnospiraceae bacterium]